MAPRKNQVVVKESVVLSAPDLATPEVATVGTYIETALKNNASVETLEKLFDLQQKAKSAAADEAFVVALTKFQRECPVIEKTKKVMNKDGHSIRYQFAPLDAIISQIRTAIADNGFSYSWDSIRQDNIMKVICKLQHRLGHFETSSMDIPIGKSKDEGGTEYMTAPQTYASAQTFAKRYTLLNVLGIATADEDNDATTVKKEATAKDPKSKIVFLLRSLNEKTATAEDCREAVKRLTKLDAVDGNYEEIVTRLEVIITERHEAA